MAARRRIAAFSLLAPSLLALTLGACSPGAPKGVDRTVLDNAVSQAIGDPDTCLLIAEQVSGKLVYRYNSHAVCSRTLPSCNGAGQQTLDQLLQATRKDGRPRMQSCPTTADASRGVGWASGQIPGKGLVYAAVMEGSRAFPGRMMADRLSRAFKDAGL